MEGATPYLSIVGTVPESGETLAEWPRTITVLFDRPIDDFSVGQDDVFLESVTASGSSTRLDSSKGVVTSLSEDRTRLVLTLSNRLDPGTYRIVLSGRTLLSGDDFSPIESDGHDRALASFTVARPGVRLADAIDLGTIGPRVKDITGELDLATDPNAVALYRFNLPAGGLWRLGAEIDTSRVGSPLDRALTLFDADGRVLALGRFGRPDSPNDPYLFAGLPAGTYYLGLSTRSNSPGEPDGHDPVQGLAGGLASQAGSGFTLRLVADEVSQPTTLLDFGIDRADDRDPTPTGFHLQFSAILKLSSEGAEIADRVDHGLEVVDDLGRTWPFAVVEYDESQSRLSLVFLDRLPEGRYTIRLSAQDRLTDLADRAPVAPGEPVGVLGRFDVGSRPPHDVNDLGAFFPNQALGGLGRAVDLAPGESIDYRFVNLVQDGFSLQIDPGGGSLRILDINPTTGEVRATYHVTTSRTIPLQLAVGAHVLRVENLGATKAQTRWRLGISAFSWERLLQNGVGQGPALELRFIAPSGPPPIALPGVGPGSGPVGSPAPTIPPGDPAPVNPGAGGGAMGPSYQIPGPPSVSPSPDGDRGPVTNPSREPGGAMPSESLRGNGPTGLFLAFGGQPVGRATSDADTVRAVGPEYGPGVVALAANIAKGPGQSIDPRDNLLMIMAADLIATPEAAPADKTPRTDPEGGDDSIDGSITPETDLPGIESPPIAVDRGDWLDRLVGSPNHGDPVLNANSVTLGSIEGDGVPAEEDGEATSLLSRIVGNRLSLFSLAFMVLAVDQARRAWRRRRLRRRASPPRHGGRSARSLASTVLPSFKASRF